MRVLATILVIAGVLIPQFACFLPANDMTQSESDCCKRMAGDCGEANMQGHSCCTGIVRPDVAIATQAHRQFGPHSGLAAMAYVSETADLHGLALVSAAIAERDIHAPPQSPGASALILRI